MHAKSRRVRPFCERLFALVAEEMFMARRFAPALAVAAVALCTLHAAPAFAAKCIAIPSSAKGCSNNGDCDDDLICAGGRCVEFFSFDVITDCDLCPVTASDDVACNTDANCTGTDGCINGFCRELQPVATDIACTTDSDCTSGLSCVDATCQLVACGGVAGIDVGPGAEDDIEQELLDSAVPTTRKRPMTTTPSPTKTKKTAAPLRVTRHAVQLRASSSRRCSLRRVAVVPRVRSDGPRRTRSRSRGRKACGSATF